MAAENLELKLTRRVFLWQSFLALNTLYLYPAFSETRREFAELDLRVYAAETGQITPCSVALRTSDGNLLTQNAGYRSGFRCPGEFKSSLPPGTTQLTITKGFDFLSETRQLELIPGQTTKCEIHLTRASPIHKEGWVCGDSHVHMLHGERTLPVNFQFVALTARAEALDYMSIAQFWSIADPTARALSEACSAVSRPDCMLHWNMEAPKNYWRGDVSHSMGHCWNLGLPDVSPNGDDPIAELFAMSASDYEDKKDPTPNFESHACIHSMGAIAVYTHPCRFWRGGWGGQDGFPFEQDKFISNMAQELPFDTVAGPTYDSIDIMMPTSERLVNEMGEQLWFMLLNQGYRIPATASSDATFDNPGRAVPGCVRVYTRIDGELTLAKVVAAMKSGYNFVTSGPLLEFNIDDHGIGDIVPITKPFKSKAHVRAWASGLPGEYLTKIEVIRNGQIYTKVDLDDKSKTHELTFAIEEEETSWYIVKCYGSQWNQYAISNPIYFEAPDYQAPEPAKANVELQVLDSGTGQGLDGSYEVIEMIGKEPKVLHRGEFKDGHTTLVVPATARIRVSASGHEIAMKSIFIDTPDLLNSVLEMQPKSLLDWGTFEHVKKILSQIQLRFEMRPSA